MRKNNYVRLMGIGIVCLILGSQIMQAQNSVLVLKGNTITPVSQQNKTTQTTKTTTQTSPATPAATQAKTSKPASQTHTQKPAPVVQAKPKPAPPVAKAAPVKNTTKAAKGKKSQREDYVKRVMFVHNLVSKRFPQNTIDSVSNVSHLMLDSIRMEISKLKDKDSVNFLQTALSSGVNDSVIIVTINNLVNASDVNEVMKNTGSINAYCIDLSTQAPMDSVKVSILNHDSLITSSYTGNDGFCKIGNLKPGEYSLSFSKNNYTPFSDRWVKVTADNVTYLEMPLTETPRFYLPRFSPQIWAMILVGIISLFVLVYSIIRRLGRVA